MEIFDENGLYIDISVHLPNGSVGGLEGMSHDQAVAQFGDGVVEKAVNEALGLTADMVRAERDRRIYDLFDAVGHTWDGDRGSIAAINSKIPIAEAQTSTPPDWLVAGINTTWTDTTNAEVQISSTDLISMRNAWLKREQTLRAKCSAMTAGPIPADYTNDIHWL